MATTTSVYQGLQSCLEPLLMEPQIITHQLVQSKHTPSQKESPNCWNFMQSVSTPSTDKVYTHPSITSLSAISLEMCTESLGSETGSFDEYPYNVSEKQSSNEAKTRKVMKKVMNTTSFPPPLTSISGSEGVQVQTHREGGRLVIKAFSYSCCSSYFQAERGDGRLRLSLLKNVETEEDEDEDEEDEEKVDETTDEGEDLRGGFCKEWASSRCNDDSSKRLPSLPFCMAIS